MPYEIKDTGSPGDKRYEIIKKATGKVVAHSASRDKAEAYEKMAHKESDMRQEFKDKRESYRQ